MQFPKTRKLTELISHRTPRTELKRLFFRVLPSGTADFAGNAQHITVGDLETNDRVALFLMDYPNQARLKMIGHARVVEADAELEAKVAVAGYPARVQRVIVVEVVALDWNCSQHITPRWTEDEVRAAMGEATEIARSATSSAEVAWQRFGSRMPIFQRRDAGHPARLYT